MRNSLAKYQGVFIRLLSYDNNGNLTKDSNKGISNIQYNSLSLPQVVTFSDGSTITYLYTANGRKLRTTHVINGTTTTTDYCGNVIYEGTTPKKLLTDEGYVDLTTATPTYYYYLKDHQGNNRVVINANGGDAVEVNHYYPFGSLFSTSTNIQPYKYNGKELDTKKGLNWYDYGARHYDATLGRFTTQDRFAEKYSPLSPYQYGANSPVCNVDVNGDSIVVAPNPNGLWDRILMFFGQKTDFQVRVYEDIAQLKKDNAEVAKMITNLENSKNIHTITMPDRKKGNNTTANEVKAKNNIPQGSTVGYNPYSWQSENGRRTPRVALAHELKHASDFDMGLYSEIEYYGVKGYEIDAVIIENRIRKVTGDNLRNNYGGKTIPEQLLWD
ncbi:MAG: hypothetical protein E7099_09835 [Mediterranea massiliensis]|nr:hypothetical protein [Mediterranea massiliensis]